MSSSDSFVIYLRSSIDLNFAVLASSDDDIASLKKKAEAQHLALFPQNGRIVAQAIKITHEGKIYSLPDNIPVRCLFDGAKGIRLLFMDAVVVPRDSAETRTHVLGLCQNGDPSRGIDHRSLNQDQGGNYNTSCTSEALKRKDPVVEEMTPGVGVLGEFAELIIQANQFLGDPSRARGRDQSLNQGGNTSCTSETLKRKSPGGSTNKDPVVEEMTPAVGVLGEFAEGSTKQNKSKDPSADEVPPSSVEVYPETGDRMQERSAAPENETAGYLVTWNPAPEGNGSYIVKENRSALEKEARKEVGDTRSTANSGETSSLAPDDSDPEDGSIDKIKSSHPTDLGDKSMVTPDNQMKDNASCSLPDDDIEVNLGKIEQNGEEKHRNKMEKSQNNSISATDSIAASIKKRRRTREKVPSSPPIRDNESEIREDASKIGNSHVVMSSEVENLTCQNQSDSHLVDDPIGETNKKKRKQDAHVSSSGKTQQFEHPLSENQKFASKDHLRTAVNEFHIHKNIEVKWAQSNRSLVVVECKNWRCKWRLYAKAEGVGVESAWVIRKCPTLHTCR